MRIDSSVIGMESARRYTSSKVQYNRFVLKEYHGGKTQANTSLLGGDVGEQEAETEKKSKSASGDYASSLQERVESMRSRSNISLRSSAENTANTFREYTTRYIFMLLFGDEETRRFFREREEAEWELSAQNNQATLELTQFTPVTVTSVVSEGYYMEQETVSFSSTGKVTTADGREISFQVDVGMSRSFYEYYHEEYDIVPLQQNVCEPGERCGRVK